MTARTAELRTNLTLTLIKTKPRSMACTLSSCTQIRSNFFNYVFHARFKQFVSDLLHVLTGLLIKGVY
jgi:hypothetical protein